MESRSTAAKKKKRKRKENKNQSETKPRISSNKSSRESNLEDNDSDRSLSNSNAVSNIEDARKPFAMFDAANRANIADAESTELSEFGSKSVDVVVDIHREYKEEKSRGSKLFGKTNAARGAVKSQNLRRKSSNEMKIDSLDLIEEFKESPIDAAQNSSEFVVDHRSRKQWAIKDETEAQKKPARKRWSKETSVIRLPDMKSNSWTNGSPVISETLHRFPKTSMAFDNAGFDSQTEEILRIETDVSRANTKIEMKEIGRKAENFANFGEEQLKGDEDSLKWGSFQGSRAERVKRRATEVEESNLDENGRLEPGSRIKSKSFRIRGESSQASTKKRSGKDNSNVSERSEKRKGARSSIEISQSLQKEEKRRRSSPEMDTLNVSERLERRKSRRSSSEVSQSLQKEERRRSSEIDNSNVSRRLRKEERRGRSSPEMDNSNVSQRLERRKSRRSSSEVSQIFQKEKNRRRSSTEVSQQLQKEESRSCSESSQNSSSESLPNEKNKRRTSESRNKSSANNLVPKHREHSKSRSVDSSSNDSVSKRREDYDKSVTRKAEAEAEEEDSISTESEDEDEDEDNLKNSDQRHLTSSSSGNEEEENSRRSREASKKKLPRVQQPKKKKKKKKELDNNAEEDSKRKKKRRKKKDAKYICVKIHRTDMLEIDYVTQHPMVKVHVASAESGKYLSKGDTGSEGTTYLQPMITGKFDFKENKSIVPIWEEELVFEHDFQEILKRDSKGQVVILFEIVDLLSFAEASFNYDKFGHEGCWYKVAWAFLKPVGRDDILHVDKKVRLQLYKPKKNSQKFDRFHNNTCEAYTWWKSNAREKYPSSLFVTVTSIDPPKSEPVLYRHVSLHDLSAARRNESQNTSTRASDSISLPKWTRLAAQSCKVPNEIFFETDSSENGCFYVAFSNDGKYLACSFSEEHDYPIVVYEVETKKIRVRFSGHKTFVYSLDWCGNDHYLLSVSSDQTARVWDVHNQIVQYVEMMPHPSYVYCGKFDPESSAVVATGCYDRVARIWTRDRKSKSRDLSQELEGHEGFVNCVCFQKNSNLLTADSVGVIIVWISRRSRRASPGKEWHISRKIRVRGIDGIVINTIVLHPLESRLLVHSRNNGLRMLDLATGVVLQKYNELNNQRIQSTACISPCGSLILCGGEDSSLNVWSLETGDLLAKYNFSRNYRAVTCVDYHPYDHALAFCTFGTSAPVRILKFDKDATGEEIGLKLTSTGLENTSNIGGGDVCVRFPNVSAMMKEKSRSSSTKNIIEERDSGLLKSSTSVLLEREKYSDAKTKLQRLNEAGQNLKSRSANKLYNIIEKIDRILSNASRSSGDVESGRNFTLLQEAGDNLDEDSEDRKKFACSNVEQRSGSYFESTSPENRRHVEFYALEDNWNGKRRSKSAKERRRGEICTEDASKAFSDSAANYRNARGYEKTGEILSARNKETSFVNSFVKGNRDEDEDSVVYFRNKGFEKEESNSSDSAGTYVVEKDGEKDSIKVFNSDSVSNDMQIDLSNAKYMGSDSSVGSNATFTIENEIPEAKVKRKSNNK